MRRHNSITLAVFTISLSVHAQAISNRQVAGANDETRPEMLRAAAWNRLEDGVTGTKNTNTRIAAISGLSLLGGQKRAEKIVGDTLHDSDIDVRLAAIVAAGEMMQHGSAKVFSTDLRNQLDDSDPKVAFTTASTLWKLNDPSGEDILLAVASGERSGDYNFWNGSKHNATRTLHSPATLAKIAAQQTMIILVPPIGMGMGAYNYLKGAGEPSPQITAITQIEKEHTEAAKNALIAATKTKDTGARVTATEALAEYRGDDVRAALRDLMTDSKETVRFTASAAYLRQDMRLTNIKTPAHNIKRKK